MGRVSAPCASYMNRVAIKTLEQFAHFNKGKAFYKNILSARFQPGYDGRKRLDGTYVLFHGLETK